MTNRICRVSSCSAAVDSLDHCAAHAARIRRHGDPMSDLPIRGRDGGQWGYYLAHVYTETNECMIWPFWVNHRGYGQVSVGRRNYPAHRLACQAWWGAPRPNMEAAHGPCHNRRCWNGAHVSWKTAAANSADMLRDDTVMPGSRHPSSKLTEVEVVQMRSDAARGVSGIELAEAFGVTQGMVSMIVNRRRWTHV